MTKTEAKKLANDVTLENIVKMFVTARTEIKDWTIPSKLNKGMSKGACFNILVQCLHVDSYHINVNQLFEFGDYYPDYDKTINKKQKITNFMHQEPFDLDKLNLK